MALKLAKHSGATQCPPHRVKVAGVSTLNSREYVKSGGVVRPAGVNLTFHSLDGALSQWAATTAPAIPTQREIWSPAGVGTVSLRVSTTFIAVYVTGGDANGLTAEVQIGPYYFSGLLGGLDVTASSGVFAMVSGDSSALRAWLTDRQTAGDAIAMSFKHS